MAGIYIHIPFCKQRCNYCAFYSSTLYNIKEEYADAVCKELLMRKEYIKGEEINTIYFGGGTPSTLPITLLQKICDTIYKNYSVCSNAEITIECNPDDLTEEFLAVLRQLPFNRISMGVQSFSDRQLKRLGRRHNAEKARRAVGNARAAGYNNISIDLMFALPGSTTKEWEDSINEAISLNPEHISAYNLMYEEDTPLHRALQRGDFEELSEEENVEQFRMLIKRMKEAGYCHYEISNFAKPGYESRHNSSYWNDTAYIGCGAAAHSYNGDSREWNISDIKEYIKGIESNNRNYEIEHLTEEERYNDTVLTRLRTSDGIPLAWIKNKFSQRLNSYMLNAAKKHIEYGYIKKTDETLSLTEKGIFISDAVIRDLIYVE
ncbi:MAG: radical SAM family heme chaperone HemW [Bacteroidaceae bacterium]|nr:radical SAM family heme chaperone HemW [Bacteroidaceae bacterium]